ncbi:hypothetical protein EUTSA_v10022545mg [Eutrema salsugineum]|uniref:TIR domain-containing protein n=1 Tax=Eutrema salsugineum TaxID=72664 RepID=V4LK77_EUTSA|nr:hypothetical protein EUTSA_v10022545mg [Eutrema salsugineum]
MDSYFFLAIVVAAISFFMLLVTIMFLFYKNSRFHQENITIASFLSPSSPPFSFPHNQKTTSSRASTVQIERSRSIGPELIDAIRGSKISIVLRSRNYAFSTWCMNELVEIMKCREELSQTVMTVFYEVDPTDVKKQEGDFGKVFSKTCKGKSREDIVRWSHALEEVAKIAGYHSSNWDNEAEMIEDIATDVSNKLFNSTPSRDFDGLVGIRAHMEKIEELLQPDLDEVGMIGILGPAGIGNSTIARFLYHHHSKKFQLSVFMENIKITCQLRACSDNYGAKLYLQEKFMSQMINHLGVKIPHLGIVEERLKDKKVLVILDDVDQLVQLESMAKEPCWFGPWSRIIITTQDQKLLRARGINHIYRVEFPSNDEALQIFCMYAFGQKSPKDGFMDLAWECSYFKEMPEHEWSVELQRLRSRLDGKIESILKFSYDALCDEDKDLFLHIACFFNYQEVEKVVEHLAKSFFHVSVRQRLHILAEKSLIYIDEGMIEMHSLLAQLGKEIVCKQCVRDPGRRRFLVDAQDICEVLTDYTTEINLRFEESKLNISETIFEEMSNLQFLRLRNDVGPPNILFFPGCLSYISPKLRLLDWKYSLMTCLPFIGNLEFLVELRMDHSKFEKLWDEIKPLRYLKWMDLSHSKNLKKLPNILTTPSLKELYLTNCSSLVELPSSIGNATNLRDLDLTQCSNLVELPSSIGNATNLRNLYLSGCSSLIELPSSIGNATNLRNLYFSGCSSLDLDLSECSSLVELPSSIWNATKLQYLYLRQCLRLVELPSSIGKASNLQTLDLSGCSAILPSSIGNTTNLRKLNLCGCSNLVELPSSITNATNLQNLNLCGCSSLVGLNNLVSLITIESNTRYNE